MKQSKNFQAMVKRKELIRSGSPEDEKKADVILRTVERNGGLTPEEIYALMVY